VRWKEQTIFAGEAVECIITFKNVAENSNSESSGHPQHPPPKTPRAVNASSNGDSYFSLKNPQDHFFHNNRLSVSQNSRQKSLNWGHRPSASAGSPFISHSFPPLHNTSNLGHERSQNNKHKRSVSILSLESEGGTDRVPIPSQFNRSRPVRGGHGRSASLQISPRTVGIDDIPRLGIIVR
jgi:RAB6A-GEF complex partner protein 2